MSLINKMLHELEKNKAGDSQEIRKVSQAAPIRPRKSITNFGHKMVYGIIIIIISFGIVWLAQPKFIIDFSKAIGLIKPPPKKVAPPAPPQPSLKLKNMIIAQQNDQTVLDYILNLPAEYHVEHRSDQQLIITINKASIEGNMPVPLDNSFIITLNTKQDNANVVSTLTLLPGTKVNDLQLLSQPEPHLHLVLSNPELTKSSMSKIPASLSPEEQELEQYKEIQNLLSQDRLQSGIQKLLVFIGDYPDNLDARVTLTSLLIKAGRLQKASDILTNGLDKHPDYLPFIKLKAHALIKQNNPLAAIDLLQKHLTSAKDDIEYLALLAALCQQQGQSIEAATIYSHLTKIQPQKTLWWIGLGVALENAGKSNAAKAAYQEAHNVSDVPAEFVDFLNTKLKN